MVFCAGDDSVPPTVRAPQVAGRTTEPPGREILRGELRGHVWWAARTGGRGQCLGGGGTPHRPCPAVLCESLDRWYRVTGASFRAGDGRWRTRRRHRRGMYAVSPGS
ncbi:g3566 [Coccomyxa elongata]